MKYSNTTLSMSYALQLEKRIAKILKKKRKEGKTITYEELGGELNLIPRHKVIARALGNLAWEDVRRGKPIRSTLVVRKERNVGGKLVGGVPGPGYFEFLRDIGFDIDKDPVQEKMFAQQRLHELFA